MSIVGAGAAHAQTANRYPTRPVRIVVPFAAGGGVDYVARILAQRLTKGMKQTLFVEIARARVARSVWSTSPTD